MPITPFQPYSSKPYGRPLHTGNSSAAKLTQPVRFGWNPLIKGLNFLEGTPLAQLVVMDIGAMVIPRTYIEAKNRGPIAGVEAFSREIVGTITNTFLMGLCGLGITHLFMAKALNPQGIDFKNAHIDANMLEHFESVTKRLLQDSIGKNQTAEAFRTSFLSHIFHNLQSTDNIAAYAEKELNLYGLFPRSGKIKTETANELVNTYLKTLLNEQKILNTAKTLDWPDNSNIAPTAKRLEAVKILRDQRDLTEKQISKQIKTFKGFIETQKKLAIDKGLLTEQVFLLDAASQKRVETLGSRSLDNVLTTTRNYMEEYLNRALHETGLLKPGATLTESNILALRKRLFLPAGNSFWRRSVMPTAEDGLIRYTYKSKNALVMIPFAITFVLGTGFVFIRNWVTRHKAHISAFPGEENLRAKLARATFVPKPFPVQTAPYPSALQNNGYQPALPRFGGLGTAPTITKLLDFEKLGPSTVVQNMVIYAGVITSRILGARSHNERREVERQDTLGYYNWFFGTPVIQIGMASALAATLFKPAKTLWITPLKSPNGSSFITKIKDMFFRPETRWKLASNGQLDNRLAQVQKFIQSKQFSLKQTDQLEILEKQLLKSSNRRPLLFLASLLLSSVSLGYIVPKYNIWRTKLDLKKHMRSQMPSVVKQRPYPASNSALQA